MVPVVVHPVRNPDILFHGKLDGSDSVKYQACPYVLVFSSLSDSGNIFSVGGTFFPHSEKVRQLSVNLEEFGVCGEI